jgi:phosphoribosylamine--glycine ligase/phosphoribosylaminoimidazole synthetase
MKVLLVGSGGREHAIAWKLAQSPLLTQLFIAPGNPGTAALGQNVPIPAEDIPGLCNFAQQEKIDLVVVGPEVPLNLGLADALAVKGIACFGPSQAAAQIEASKSFAKDFFQRHAIPTASYKIFDQYQPALDYLEKADFPLVIKASGLAAGKGVILPETQAEARQTLQQLMLEKTLGAAGEHIIIEERLSGEEVSLMAFSDGQTLRWMPPAQDHKRLLKQDQGPNTGGMGAYAPAPLCPPELAEKWTRELLQPAADGLRQEGMPFVGVLYAGIMVTANGPKLLEFNCRFGDPETQVVLPLLESDLLEIIDACTKGQLHTLQPRWKQGACACVVAASQKYPYASQSGPVIHNLDQAYPNCMVFQAGTRLENQQVVVHGGRVLGVTGWGTDLQSALDSAYAALEHISFDGMQYRKDIGSKGLRKNSSAYAQAGVNIDAGNQAVALMSSAVRSTYTPAVLAGIGSFGGLFDAAQLQRMHNPVLVASTDGVGTKVKLATQANRYFSVGQDIVNHCIDDILVQGARPLFFLDYFATSRLDPQMTAQIVSGMADACKASACVLIGGETAEMPGVYQPGEFDVAGTIVGVVERERILPRPDLQVGDLLVGLRSNSPHTNGYSLIRKVFENIPLDTIFSELGEPLVDALLRPHRSYLPVLENILQNSPAVIKALAHITGGGFLENIPRVLPSHLNAAIFRGTWPIPALYPLIQKLGQIQDDEMARVFNMGIGMVAVIAPQDLGKFQQGLSEASWVIGELTAGERKVIFK